MVGWIHGYGTAVIEKLCIHRASCTQIFNCREDQLPSPYMVQGSTIQARHSKQFSCITLIKPRDRFMQLLLSLLPFDKRGTGYGGFKCFSNFFKFTHSMSGCHCLVTQSYPTLGDPTDCNMPGFPVLHHLSELAQTLVHWVRDAIQQFCPLSSPSPPAFNLSQHQGLF